MDVACRATHRPGDELLRHSPPTPTGFEFPGCHPCEGGHGTYDCLCGQGRARVWDNHKGGTETGSIRGHKPHNQGALAPPVISDNLGQNKRKPMFRQPF